MIRHSHGIVARSHSVTRGGTFCRTIRSGMMDRAAIRVGNTRETRYSDQQSEEPVTSDDPPAELHDSTNDRPTDLLPG